MNVRNFFRNLGGLGKLGRRLLIPFLLVGMVSVVGAAAASWFSVTIQRRSAADLQQEVAAVAVARIDAFIEDIRTDLKVGADKLGQIPADDQRQQLAVLRDLNRANPALYELSIIDQAGQETVKLVGRMPAPAEDLARQTDSKKYLTPMTGEEFIGEVYISEFDFPFVSFAVPVFDARGGVAMVLAAEVDVNQIWDQIAKITAARPEYTVYVVDQAGHLIAFRDTNRTRALPDLTGAEAGIEGVRAFVRGDLVPREYQGIPDEYGQSVRVIGARQRIPSTHWGVIVERPLSVAYRTVNLFILLSAALVITSVAIIGAVGWYISRSVIQPLAVLRAGAARLGRGKLTHRIQISTNDEIQALAAEFNAMAANLQQSQSELAATARQNEALALEAQARVREITSLVEAGRAITSLDLERVLNTLAKEAARAVTARLCLVYVLDEHQQVLLPQACWHALDGDYSPPERRLGDGVVGWVAQQAQGFSSRNLLADERFAEVEAASPYRCVLALPLQISQRVVGALLVADKANDQPFLGQDENLLCAFADQAAIAVENAELFREQQRRADELTLVNQLSRTVMASLDLETTIDAILRNLRTLFDYRAAEINLWDEKNQRLNAYAVGDTAYTSAVGNYYRLDEGFTGWLARERQPLLISDVAAYTGVRPKGDLAGAGYRSYIGVPLVADERFLGTMELIHVERQMYSRQDVATLELLANQAAIAILHATLYQDARQQAEAQARLARITAIASTTLDLDELLQRTMVETVAAVGAESGAVLLLNEEKSELYAHPAGFVNLDPGEMARFRIDAGDPSFKQSPSITGKGFTSNNAPQDDRILAVYRPYVDIFNLKRVLVVPLVTPEENLGELYVFNKPADFAESDRRFVTSVAALFAAAIQNARLFHSTQQNLKELSIIYKTTADLSSTLSVDEVLANLTRRMISILPVDECAISKYDEVNETLETIYQNRRHIPPGGDAIDNEGAVYQLADFPQSRAVLQSKEPLVVRANDAAADPAEVALLDRLGYSTLVMLPLVIRDEPIGLVELYATEPRIVSRNEINLAQALTHQAAIALHNAQLFSMTDARLHKRVEELIGLQRVGRQLNSTLDVDNTLSTVLKEAAQATGADYGNVSLHQPETGHLVARAGFGWPEEALSQAQAERMTVQMGVVGRVLRTGKPALVDDVDLDPDYVRVVPDTRSEVAVPIRYAGAVAGVINLESRRWRAFNEDQLHYLEALADQAAIAIGNAQAYDEQRQAHERASRRANQLARIAEISRSFRTDQPLEAVLEDIAYAIQEVVDFNIALFSVVRGEFLYRVAAAGVPLANFERAKNTPVPLETVSRFLKDEFLISQSYFIPAERAELWEGLDYYDPYPTEQDQEAEPAPNTWQLQDALLTPLYSSTGEIIGLLSVDHPVDGKRPSVQQIQTLEIFANQAATAIENANLFQEASQRASLLRLSSQIGRRISAILDPDELLAEVVELIRDAFGYDHVHIFQSEEVEQRLLVRSSAGENGRKSTSTAWRLDEIPDSVVSWVVAEREHKLLNDLQEHPEFKPSPGLPAVMAELAVPLRIGDQVWGALDVQSNKPHVFSDDDVFVLQTLADQLAIALENSRLFDDSLRRERLSSALGQAGLQLLSSLNTREVLDLVCQEALKVFEVDSTFMWLVEGEELVGVAAEGRNAGAFIGLRIPMTDDSTLGVQIVKERQAKFVNGVDFAPESVNLALAERLQAKSAMGAPLIFGEETLGALMFIDCQNSQRFDVQDRASATLLANQAAAAIENARLFDALEWQVRQLRTLTQVSSALQRALDLDEVLALVMESVFAIIGKEQGFIMLHNAERQTLELAKTRNIPDSMVQIFNESNVSAQAEPFAQVFERGQMVEVKTPVPADITEINYAPGTDRTTYLPLQTERGVIGILAIEEILGNEVTRNLVQTLADLAAIAIDKTRLFVERERRITELATLNKTGQALSATLDQDALLALIHQQASQVMNADNFFVAFYDETKDVVSFPYHVDSQAGDWSPRTAGNGLTEYVIRTREPLLVRENVRERLAALGVEQIGTLCQAWLGVPLVAGDRVLGVVAVQSYDSADAYSDNDLNILLTMASQAAIAIENIRLLENARARADEMQQLYDLGVTVSSRLDVQQVLRLVISEARSLTQTPFASIFLWDEDSRQFIIEGSAGSPELEARLPLRPPRQDGLIRQVLRTGRPLLVVDAAEDKRVSAHVIEAGIRSCLAVPIMIEGEATGVIFVSSLSPRKFGDHDVRLLSFVANQAAVAIRNAQLVERLNRFNEELEQRVEERTEALARTLGELTVERDRVSTLYSITKELSTSLDLDRVLIEALSLINRAVGVSYGSILMLDSSTGYLTYRAALNRATPLPRGGSQTHYKVGVGLAGKVMEERQPRIVYDVCEDPDWLPSRDDEGDRRAALAVPLITGEDVLGVLLLYHPQPGYFNEDHLKLVSTAATQVATAINNAELYNLITEQAARLGVLLRNVQAEANKNQAIVEGITDGVIVLDVDQNIVLINPAAGRLLGLEPQEVSGLPLREILGKPRAPVDQDLVQSFVDYIDSITERVQDEEAGSLETRLGTAEKVLVVNVAPVVLNPGAGPSLVTALRDISREAEVERIKNEFISTVSHELRTPMTSIKGYSDLLISGKAGDLSDIQQKFVQVIKANADRLTALVNDILDISRVEMGRVRLDLQALDLSELIQSVATSFEAQMLEKRISLVLDLPDKLPPVWADKSRLTQILVNLLSNAWKYTLPEGSVTIRAQVRNGAVQVDVKDTGIGIGDTDLARVFDRFYRVERREVLLADGTGLGLSIVKMFVEMLGGQIWAESEVGLGSTFSFTLPQAVEETGPGPDAADAVWSPEKTRVLVVDDEPELVERLCTELERDGYEVLTATTGQEALRLAQTAQPHLITLDIILPDIDGFEVLARLKADPATQEIPVIIISVVSDSEQEGFALGAADYVTKPFNHSQVIGVVEQLVASGGHAGSLNRILVVDDEPDIVAWLDEALTANGFDVCSADNGPAALELAQTFQPDLILLDIKMPNMDGFEVMRRLRSQEATATIPIIVITGSAVDKDNGKIRMLGLGARQILAKPISIETLVAEIKRMEQAPLNSERD